MKNKKMLITALALVLVMMIGLVSARGTPTISCNSHDDLGSTKACDVTGLSTCERTGHNGNWHYYWSDCVQPVVNETETNTTIEENVTEPVVNETIEEVVPVVIPYVFHNHRTYNYPEVTMCRDGVLVYWKIDGVVELNLPAGKQFGELVPVKFGVSYPSVC